jgi:hypothetical protein
MHFGDFKPSFNAALPNGTVVPIGLNHECKPGHAVFYTHMLGKSTRATNHFEVIVEDPKQKNLSWHVGETYTLQVKAINPSGNSTLSDKIAVLSFSKDVASKASQLHPGDTIKVEFKTLPELKNVITACHTIFPVVQNGKALTTFDASGAILHRNPRTSIGFNNRYFFMVVVDGRQKQLSMGMNAHELAEYMSALGCTEAMNLDGGGSTTFWMSGGKVHNSVPGGTERGRGDALFIVRQANDKAAGGGHHTAAAIR